MLCGLSGSGRPIGHAALDEGSGFLMRGFARQFTTIGMVGWPLLTEVDPRAGMLAAPVVVVVADIGADPILPVIVDCCVVGTITGVLFIVVAFD